MSEHFTTKLNPRSGSSRRRGIFTIHEDLISHPDIRVLLAECNRIDERASDESGYRDFIVEHPEFDEIGEGEIMPHYLAYFTRDENDIITRDKIERCQ